MDAQKLAKILAMAASDNEVEAVHALRMARRLLAGSGVDFVEVARRVADGGIQPANAGSAQARIEDLEDAVFDLRNEIRQVRAENERLRHTRAPAVPAAPPTLAEAARDAVDAIRLRAELAAMTDRLEEQQAEILRLKAHGIGLSEQADLARADAARLAGRVQELDGRRILLEAESRRLATANRALSRELDQSHGAPPEAVKTRAPKPKPAAKTAGQYALL